MQRSFYPFLATYAPTLKSLDIHLSINRACKELILGSMPKLTSLKTRRGYAAVDWQQALPVNTTIFYYEWDQSVYRPQLRHIPYENFVGSMLSLKHFKRRLVGSAAFAFSKRSELGDDRGRVFEYFSFSWMHHYPQHQKVHSSCLPWQFASHRHWFTLGIKILKNCENVSRDLKNE